MEENEKSPHWQQFLPPEVIRAKISIDLTKQYGNYQAVVNGLPNMYVGEDNLEDAQRVILNVNSFLKTIEESRKEQKEPFLEQGREIDRVYREFSEPIVNAVKILQLKLNAVGEQKAKRLQEEQAKRDAERAITEKINQFHLQNSLKIASATNIEQLDGYQRIINLERSKKSVYADQLPVLIERCDSLNNMVNNQKELIREKNRIEEEKKKADDEKLEALIQREQELSQKIEENAIVIQEQASSSLILSNEDDGDVAVVKARRTIWKAELINVKEAVKKSIDMLDISLDATKVRDSINTLKAAGAFKGKTELIVNGIRYYEEKTF